MFTTCLAVYFIFNIKRETREVDESLTANLIEEAVYDAHHMMEIATKSGQLGYLHYFILLDE